MPSSIRPSESWSSVAAVIAVIAGGAAGHLEDRRAELDRLVCLREPAEDRRRVGAVGLRGPDGVVAERLGLLDELELLVARGARAPSSRCARRVSSLRSVPCRRLRRHAARAATLSPGCRPQSSPAGARAGDARRRPGQPIVSAPTRRPRRHLPDARRAPQRRAHELARSPARGTRSRARARPPGDGARAARARGPAGRVAGATSSASTSPPRSRSTTLARSRPTRDHRPPPADQRPRPIRSTSRSRCSGENGLVRKRSAPASGPRSAGSSESPVSITIVASAVAGVGAQPPAGLDPVQPRHVDVEEDDLRLHLDGALERLLAVAASRSR